MDKASTQDGYPFAAGSLCNLFLSVSRRVGDNSPFAGNDNSLISTCGIAYGQSWLSECVRCTVDTHMLMW